MAQNGYSGSHTALVAIGPKELEVERLRDLAESLAWYEPKAVLVAVDDHPEPRHLDRALAHIPGLRVVSLHHRRTARPAFLRSVGICSVIMTGLQWIADNTDAPFAVKLDTDSLVIAPYGERLFAHFRDHPAVGMAGAYLTDARGRTRNWSVHAETIAGLVDRINWRRPRYTLRTWNDPLKARIRALHQAASDHGYVTGEHCLGGGYAVSRGLLDAMAAARVAHGASVLGPWVTLSIGVACVTPTADGRPTHLTRRADMALYQAKSQGRACFVADETPASVL